MRSIAVRTQTADTTLLEATWGVLIKSLGPLTLQLWR